MVGLVLAIGGGTAWWWLGGSLRGSGVDALARLAPADTRLFVAWSPRQGSHLQDLHRSLLDAGLGTDLARWESRVGFRAAEAVSWADAGGMLAVLPPEGQQGLVKWGATAPIAPDWVVCWGVHDREAAEQSLDRRAEHSRRVEVEGVTLRVGGSSPHEWVVGLDGPFLLVGSGVAAVQRVLRTRSGRAPNLATESLFREARQKLAAPDGLFVFCPVDRALEGAFDGVDLEASARERISGAVAAARYLAASATRSQEPPFQAFLALDTTSGNAVVRRLLDRPDSGPDLEPYLPADCIVYGAGNLSWIYRVALSLPPPGRAEMLPDPVATVGDLGIDFDRLLTGSLPVRLAVATDLRRSVRAREGEIPTTLICADVKEPRKVVDALESAMETPLARATRRQRTVAGISVYSYPETRFPGRLGAWSKPPYFTWAIAGDGPRPVLVIACGPRADAMMDRSLRQASETGKTSTPRYWQGLARPGSPPVWSTCVNRKPLVEWLATALESRSTEWREVTNVLRHQAWSERYDQLVVERGGLRYESNLSWEDVLGVEKP